MAVLPTLRLRRLLSTVAITAVVATPATALVSPSLDLDRVVQPPVLTDSGSGSTLDNDPVEGPAAPLVAGAAEGLLRVPVGTPLGGYLRPPVGGELFGEQTPAHYTDLSA